MKTCYAINDISGGYETIPVIKEVSFHIQKGDFLGIIGPNGSGKSTLLRLMSRALLPYSGEIFLEGIDIKKIALKEFCRSIAFVPQDTLINFSFSVEEIVLMGRIPHLKRLQAESKRDFAAANKALTLTDTLGLKQRPINELSAGERQRAIIAKALAQEPVLLILDEPTSHLDIGHQVQIMNLLKRLNREDGLTIVIVLHDLNLASEYCRNLILLNEGRIFKQGAPEEVLTYQNIEEVYKTVVVVNKNPISNKPFVLLTSEEGRNGDEVNFNPARAH